MNAPHLHTCPLVALLLGREVPASPPRLAPEDVELVATRVAELLAAPPARQVWLTVPEAAAHTGRSRRTLYRAIHADELRTEQQRTGARHAVHRDELDRWLTGRPAETRPAGTARGARVRT